MKDEVHNTIAVQIDRLQSLSVREVECMLQLPVAGTQSKEPPRLATGQIDAYALSIIGRQLGINAVIIGSLENIRKVEELRGILWNRETIHLVRLVVRMEVYQPLTATKVLDSIYRRDVPIDEMEYEQSSAPGRWKRQGRGVHWNRFFRPYADPFLCTRRL